MDKISESDNTDSCYAPIILIALPGITKVPMFPKGGAGLRGTKSEKMRSTVVVKYDDYFRIILFSPSSSHPGDEGDFGARHDQSDLWKVMAQANTTEGFPLNAEEAFDLASSGRPAAAGGRQKQASRSGLARAKGGAAAAF